MDFISKVTPECIKIKGISPDNAIERLESLPDFDDQPGYEYLSWVSCYNDLCLIHADYKVDNGIFPRRTKTLQPLYYADQVQFHTLTRI